jgi:hypothetical protein
VDQVTQQLQRLNTTRPSATRQAAPPAVDTGLVPLTVAQTELVSASLARGGRPEEVLVSSSFKCTAANGNLLAHPFTRTVLLADAAASRLCACASHGRPGHHARKL